MVFHELLNNDDYHPYFFRLTSVLITFSRFICTSILHLSLIDEVTIGLEMMKYCSNHPYKFDKLILGYTAGLLQVISVLMIELASMGIICTANDVINIIFNFIALAIVAEFDNYVYSSLKNEPLKQLTLRQFHSKIVVINHTTSVSCRTGELSDCLDETGTPR